MGAGQRQLFPSSKTHDYGMSKSAQLPGVHA